MKTLIARRDLVYANRTYVAGQEFRVANQHAKIYVLSGMAVEAPEKVLEPPVRRTYRRRDMRAEE
jgi:hypothetical protein